MNLAQQAAIWSGAGQTRLTRPADQSEQRRMVGGGAWRLDVLIRNMMFQPALQISVFLFCAIKIALGSHSLEWWSSCRITMQNQPQEIVRGSLSNSQNLRGEGRVLTSDPCSYIDCSCLLWGDSDVSDGQGTASVYPYHRHFPPPLYYHQISYTTVYWLSVSHMGKQ